MNIVNGVKKSLRFLGWLASIGTVVWGSLYYWRFNNPVVDAFHGVSGQLAALELAAETWKRVGLGLFLAAIFFLGLGYLGSRSASQVQVTDTTTLLDKEQSQKNVAEGT